MLQIGQCFKSPAVTAKCVRSPKPAECHCQDPEMMEQRDLWTVQMFAGDCGIAQCDRRRGQLTRCVKPTATTNRNGRSAISTCLVFSLALAPHNTPESKFSPLNFHNTVESNTVPPLARVLPYIKCLPYSNIVTSCLICYPNGSSSTTTPICSTIHATIGTWSPSYQMGPGEKRLHRRLMFPKGLNSSFSGTMRRKSLRKSTPVSRSARSLLCIEVAAHCDPTAFPAVVRLSPPFWLMHGNRHPLDFYLHFQQRRPHTWQYDPLSPSAESSRHLLRLQGSSSTRSVRLPLASLNFLSSSFYRSSQLTSPSDRQTPMPDLCQGNPV